MSEEEWQTIPEDLRVTALPDRWEFTLLSTMEYLGKFWTAGFKRPSPHSAETDPEKGQDVENGVQSRIPYQKRFPDENAFRRELKNAAEGKWEGYEEDVISLRYGVDGDPGHQGYHGLKRNVTDDFLQIGEPEKTQTDVVFHPYRDGVGKIYCTKVFSDREQEALILVHSENGFVGRLVFDGIPELTCGTGWIKTEDLTQIDSLKYYSGGMSHAVEFTLKEKTGEIC